jgi:nitroimidazol reductase NimA-like FMN-containing flavoprotein (pyridoxamine 5'-phosphate oxidase superfamily)
MSLQAYALNWRYVFFSGRIEFTEIQQIKTAQLKEIEKKNKKQKKQRLKIKTKM